MTGRDWYRRLSPIFAAFTKILKLFPAGVSRGIYNWTMWVPGKLGVALRVPLAQRLCRTCGTNIALHRSVVILNWQTLDVGDNVQVHPFCYLDAAGEISIGNDVSIAHSSSIVSFEHTWGLEDLPIKYNPLSTAPINIEADVWIGCGVRILAGADIASRTVIAAGSVVIRGRHKPGLYAGVPAKHRKDL